MSSGRPSAPLAVRLLGTPPEEARYDLRAEIHRRGLDDVVTFTGQVSYAEALQEMMRADILLLLDSPGRKVGVPAKLYEYIGAGRPILALGEPDGDLAATLEASGRPYRIAAPALVDAIGRALAELAAGPTTIEPGRADPFTRESVAGSLAGVLGRLCGTASPSVPAPTLSSGMLTEHKEMKA